MPAPCRCGPVMDAAARRRLRAALEVAAPWLVDDEVGPTSVDAGACDRCGDAPRVVATCGPAPARTLCVDCVLDVGVDGWCDGHADVAAHVRSWAAAVPPWWADAVVLWWIATGEVRTTPGLLGDVDALPTSVRVLLPPATDPA